MNARQDVAVIEPEPTSILTVIERAARSPDVDLDKMERLLAMHERTVMKQAETSFNQSMTDAQSAMGRISTDATNPQTRSKYATYGKLDRELRPIYTQHGFALSFDTDDSPLADHIRVVCHVSHRDGFSKRHHIDMPADGKGAKGGDVMTKTHATGAASSYGMRYLLKMIFNVAIGEDDTDGNPPPTRTVKVPENYDRWKADMNAVADEGHEALKAAWAKSEPRFRQHATEADADWWAATKQKAGA